MAAVTRDSLYLHSYPQGPGEPQEMWSLASVPEGGMALGYLLLAGLCCFGAVFMRSRRKISAG